MARTTAEKVQDIRAGLIAQRVLGLASVAATVIVAAIYIALTT